MSGVRTRSSSVGRVSRDGVNLLQREVTSARQHEMIVQGRAAALERLEAVTHCPVKLMERSVMHAGVEMDEFSFRRADVSSMDRLELFAKLKAIATVVNETEGVILVCIDQRSYDHRALGLDLTTGQCALLLGLIVLSIWLVIFVLGIDVHSHWQAASGLWPTE